MNVSLKEQAERVETKDDFVAFVLALSEYFAAHEEARQHWTIDHYLETLATWMEESMDRFYQERGEQPPAQLSWKVCATLFIAPLEYA
jgi:hypothetical protein